MLNLSNYLKDNKTIDYIPDESSIAAFRERVFGMIGSVCVLRGLWRIRRSWDASGAIAGICARLGRIKRSRIVKESFDVCRD